MVTPNGMCSLNYNPSSIVPGCLRYLRPKFGQGVFVAVREFDPCYKADLARQIFDETRRACLNSVSFRAYRTTYGILIIY